MAILSLVPSSSTKNCINLLDRSRKLSGFHSRSYLFPCSSVHLCVVGSDAWIAGAIYSPDSIGDSAEPCPTPVSNFCSGSVCSLNINCVNLFVR